MNEKIVLQPKFKDRLVLIGKDNIVGLSKSVEDKQRLNSNITKVNKYKLLNDYLMNSNEKKQVNKNVENHGNQITGGEKSFNNIPTHSYNLQNYTIENSTINENSELYEISYNKNSPNKTKFNEISRNNHNFIQESSYNKIPVYTQCTNNNILYPYLSIEPQRYVYLNPNILMIPTNINSSQTTNTGQTYDINLYPNEITNKMIRNEEMNEMKKINNYNILPVLNNKKEQKKKRVFSSKLEMNRNKSHLREITYNNDISINKKINDFTNHNIQETNQTKHYSPYTLKDYKELINEKILFGGLGANIGTEEWKLRMNKMKKINQYSESVKRTNKNILKPIKKAPDQEIMMIKLENIEKSKKTRAKMYGNILKNKNRNRVYLSSPKIREETLDENKGISKKYRINFSINEISI